MYEYATYALYNRWALSSFQIGAIISSAAMNIFANAVVMQRRIPFEIKAYQKSANEDFKNAFYALRESARKNGLQDMTLEEINEEIRQARLERAEREKASL